MSVRPEEEIGPGLARLGIDPREVKRVVLTHFHTDHAGGLHHFPEAEVFVSETELGLARGLMGRLRGYLPHRWPSWFEPVPIAFPETPFGAFDRSFPISVAGDVRAVPTPGHTPGHLAIFIPEHDLIFSGDIDLTTFGPFYGHDFADIDDFLSSIGKLKQANAKMVISGHAGPFNGNLAARFEKYEQVIFTRDRLLLENLIGPKSVDDLKGAHLFYKSYPDFPELIRWFELVHIEKHFMRLKTMGKVRQEDNKWIKC